MESKGTKNSHGGGRQMEPHEKRPYEKAGVTAAKADFFIGTRKHNVISIYIAPAPFRHHSIQNIVYSEYAVLLKIYLIQIEIIVQIKNLKSSKNNKNPRKRFVFAGFCLSGGEGGIRTHGPG